MGFFNRAKKIIKPHVNVPKWIDYQTLASSTQFIVRQFRSMFIPAKSTYTETFEEAVSRLKLKEQDLIKRQEEFYYFSWLYFSVGILLLAYAIYVLFAHLPWVRIIICIPLGLVMIGHAFRSRFWYFQTKTRRLGYTFSQWFNADIRGRTHD